MKKAEVKIGEAYVAKISNKLTAVRLDAKCGYGGWMATNLFTGREVRIRSAQKLRRPYVPKKKPVTFTEGERVRLKAFEDQPAEFARVCDPSIKNGTLCVCVEQFKFPDDGIRKVSLDQIEKLS